MQEYDVAIVGGGPIGGYIAGKIAEKKYKVAIFEKNKQIGLPLNCAGLITPRVFNLLNFSEKNIVQNIIKGANIHSPSNNILSIGGDKVHAYAINRTLFDQEIIKQSEQKEADIFLNNNVLSAQKIANHIEITTSKKLEIKSKLLIGADGPFSKVRDRFVFYEPKEIIKGFGAELDNTSLNPDFVEIFVGNNIAPTFFAWFIPINKDGTKARAGLCVSQNAGNSPKYYFDKLLKNKKILDFIKDAKITKNIGGVIPLGILKKTYSSNVMIVGDAAAQVKPTSGGGIYTGILCGNHCSNVAIEALEKNDFSSNFLKKYQKLWIKEVGRELNLGMKFRSIYRNLSDKQFDKYIEKFNNPKIVDIINKNGDIDYPSKLLKPLITKIPLLIRLLPNAIKEKN